MHTPEPELRLNPDASREAQSSPPDSLVSSPAPEVAQAAATPELTGGSDRIEVSAAPTEVPEQQPPVLPPSELELEAFWARHFRDQRRRAAALIGALFSTFGLTFYSLSGE